MRPQSIAQFEKLYIVSIILSLLSSLVMMRVMPAVLPPDAPAGIAHAMPFIVIGGAVFGLVVGLLLLYFIARRGSEIAKWIFVIFFLFSLAGLVRKLFGPVHVALPGWVTPLAVVQVLIHGACVWLLFRPDAKAWFQR